MLERDVQKKCVAYARKTGWWARKFTAQGRRSVPDYIFAKQGRVIFIEFKKTGEKPTELQEEEHRQMWDAGLLVSVCDNVEVFKQAWDFENATLACERTKMKFPNALAELAKS